MSECLFCNIITGDIPADIVYEDDFVLAFRDINPQAPVHILIIPKKHLATLDDMEEQDIEVMGRLYWAAKHIAIEEGLEIDQDEKGYRLVMNCGRGGGQMVCHVHLHLMGGRGFGWPPG